MRDESRREGKDSRKSLAQIRSVPSIVLIIKPSLHESTLGRLVMVSLKLAGELELASKTSQTCNAGAVSMKA